jgi:hypothetical protein
MQYIFRCLTKCVLSFGLKNDSEISLFSPLNKGRRVMLIFTRIWHWFWRCTQGRCVGEVLGRDRQPLCQQSSGIWTSERLQLNKICGDAQDFLGKHFLLTLCLYMCILCSPSLCEIANQVTAPMPGHSPQIRELYFSPLVLHEFNTMSPQQ